MIRNRYFIVTLLTSINLVNYFDRYVVAAIGTRIQENLQLDDGSLGWVLNAFMVGYMVTSPLFGWLGDRFQRKGLICGGILLWSAATALSGLAQSFAPLIAARILVGVGEASYASISPTIIDDIAEKDAKNRYLAVFYSATPIGSALGFIVGGQLEALYGWRTAFFIAGIPGLLFALLALLIHEPKRIETREGASFFTAYRTLIQSPLYLFTVAGYIAQTFALGGFTSWVVAFLYRKHCFELSTASSIFGTVTVVTGFVGTALGGFIGDRFGGKDRVRTALRICAWSSILGAPFALAAVMMPTAKLVIGALALCEIFVFLSVAPINTATLQSVPPAIRANAMAVSIFAIHALGDLLSPILIGRVSDAYSDSRAYCQGAKGLQMGMYTLPLALVFSAVFWWIGSRLPRHASEAANQSVT